MSTQEGSVQAPTGPPYPPSEAALGGTPSIIPDVPITAVFLFLFTTGAAMHMTIFQLNKKRAHKFLMTLLVF
ncbi:hypothetical protein LTS18_004631, partial [Coniosporium uncinatum]